MNPVHAPVYFYPYTGEHIMMKSMLSKAAVAAAALGLGTSAALAQPAIGRAQVMHTIPAVLAKAHLLRHHNPVATMQVTVSLKLRNTVQLASFLQDVQNPNSPEYHHFLTPQQFTETYGPTQANVDAVVQYLNANGIRVSDVSANRMLIHAEGQSAQMEQAFGITINDYSLNGATYYASAANPALPGNLVQSVQSVIGLNDLEQLHPMLAPRSVAAHRGKPGGGGTPAGYSPQQIAAAYNWPSVTGTANGTGEKIAIGTAYSYKSSDVTGFWSHYGLPSHTVTIVPVDGSTTRANVETTIDIERSGAMAPGATILVYEGANAQFTTFTDVYNKIVTDDQAAVMTTSWGAAESSTSTATMQTDDNIFAQGAAEGISLFAAAGDNGSSDGSSNQDEADFPSSDPYVAAAGGTSLTLTSNNTIASETAWSGTGGAESHYFVEPSWQVGTNVPQDGFRQTSDLALDADPNTGYSVLYGGRWSVYGGTSFVAPQLAALFAVRVSQNGTRVGQANKAVYAIANGSRYASDFHDITSGSNGAFNAGSYWDHPTGWGSLNASNLLLDLQ